MSEAAILSGGSHAQKEQVDHSLAVDSGIPGYYFGFAGLWHEWSEQHKRRTNSCRHTGHSGGLTAFREWGDRIAAGEWELDSRGWRDNL
jgi:hypothetical protein